MLKMTIIVITIILTRLMMIPCWLTADAGNQRASNSAYFSYRQPGLSTHRYHMVPRIVNLLSQTKKGVLRFNLLEPERQTTTEKSRVSDVRATKY
jgi:hypothetical protein